MEGFHVEIGLGSKITVIFDSDVALFLANLVMVIYGESKITVYKSGKVVNSLEFLTWKAVKTIGKKRLKYSL